MWFWQVFYALGLPATIYTAIAGIFTSDIVGIGGMLKYGKQGGQSSAVLKERLWNQPRARQFLEHLEQGWLLRYASPSLAYIKIASIVIFQISLLFLILSSFFALSIYQNQKRE